MNNRGTVKYWLMPFTNIAKMTHSHNISFAGWGFEETTNVLYKIIWNSWLISNSCVIAFTQVLALCLILVSGPVLGRNGIPLSPNAEKLCRYRNKVAWTIPGVFSISNHLCWNDGANYCGEEHILYQILNLIYKLSKLAYEVRGKIAQSIPSKTWNFCPLCTIH